MPNKTCLFRVASAVFILVLSPIAMSADFSFWRVASTLEQSTNGKRSLHEMWLGNSTTSLICSSQPVPCNIVLHVNAVDDISLAGTFKGDLYVVTPDPLMPPGFIPSNVVEEYKVTGDLNFTAGVVTGEIKFGNGVKKQFTGIFAADLLSITPFSGGAPVSGGAVVRVEGTLIQ